MTELASGAYPNINSTMRRTQGASTGSLSPTDANVGADFEILLKQQETSGAVSASLNTSSKSAPSADPAIASSCLGFMGIASLGSSTDSTRPTGIASPPTEPTYGGGSPAGSIAGGTPSGACGGSSPTGIASPLDEAELWLSGLSGRQFPVSGASTGMPSEVALLLKGTGD